MLASSALRPGNWRSFWILSRRTRSCWSAPRRHGIAGEQGGPCGDAENNLPGRTQSGSCRGHFLHSPDVRELLTVAAAGVPTRSELQATEALQAFRAFTMAHPRLIEARDELIAA